MTERPDELLFDYKLYLQREETWNQHRDIVLPHSKSETTKKKLKQPVTIRDGTNIQIDDEVVVPGKDAFRICCLGLLFKLFFNSFTCLAIFDFL